MEEMTEQFKKDDYETLMSMDNAAYFKSEAAQAFIEGTHIQALWSVPCEPPTGGVAERAVRTMKGYMIENERDWDSPVTMIKMHYSINPDRELRELYTPGGDRCSVHNLSFTSW